MKSNVLKNVSLILSFCFFLCSCGNGGSVSTTTSNISSSNISGGNSSVTENSSVSFSDPPLISSPYAPGSSGASSAVGGTSSVTGSSASSATSSVTSSATSSTVTSSATSSTFTSSSTSTSSSGSGTTAPTLNQKYTFDGSISLNTLNNYLNRTMVFCQFFQEDDFNMVIDSTVNSGVKYIQRAACLWPPGTWEYVIKGTIKDRAERIHAADPEVVLEACIFECVDSRVEKIAIPAEVFEAFGLPYESRTFDLEKMIFPDGSYKNKWGTGAHVPDITQLETQMFFYHRAMFFIDLGFEALHLGQTNLVGKNDTNNKCWTKVIKMIRDYAKENARRHYVIINGHNPNQNFVGSDGVMLVDFNAFPLRISVAPYQTDHAPSETNPQYCIITPGEGDAVYKRNISGVSPSGWYSDKYPYLVEVDNWGISAEKHLNKTSSYIWGYDEITWFAIQPQWYRQKFIEELTIQIDSFGENGHLSVPGKRWIGVVPGGNGSDCYYAAEKSGDVNYYGDLKFYKNLWNRLGK